MLFAASAAQAAVTVNKTFSPSSMTVGGTSTITITLGNTGTSAATGTAFTDNLPAGLVVASPSNVATTCGGTASAAAGGSTVSLSGGTIAPNGGTCTVTAAVTSNTLGSYTNTIPAGGVTSSQGSNSSAASATLAVIARQPITGSFGVAFPPGFGGDLKGNGPAGTTTVTLNNPNTLPLTNVGTTFSIAQPVVAFATPSNLSTTCGGTVTLATGTGTLSGGTIPANGNCSITFDIVAALPNAYFFANTPLSIPAATVTDDQGITNAGAISANIGVQTGSRVDKSFLPTSIISGGTSTLKLTINNFNYSALSSINLTDTLPSVAAGAMTVAPTPNASTTCGGTVTATAGSSSVQLSGGSLPPTPAAITGSASCTIKLDVVGTNTGATAINLTNSIPAGNFGGINYPAATANLTVTPNQPLFGSNKVISNQSYAGTALTEAGSTHTLTITLDNTTTSPITVTSFTDDVATMGTGFTITSSPAPSTTCVGGTVSAPMGGTMVTMAGGTIPAGNGTNAGTCTITAGIYFPLTPASLGSHFNTIPVGNVVTSAGNNTTPITFGVNVYTPLLFQKSFSPAAVNPGGISTLTIGIGYVVASGGTGVDPLTNISDTDTLPSGLVIATPSGLTSTCNVGATVSAPAGGSAIAFSGVNLNPGQSCAVTVNVRVPVGTPTGTLSNVIPANSATTDQGVTNSTVPIGGQAFGSGAAAANLIVGNANVTINKTFTPATVAVGTASQLAINFVNTNPGNIAIAGASLIDTLPAGMVVANPATASFTGSGCTGTVTATPGGSAVSLANASIAANTTCTLKVNVVGTAAGNLINTVPAGALVSAQAVTNTSPTTATLQATGTANLAITKTDGVTSVATGTTTTYTVAVSNAGPNNVVGATVTDAQPSGMTFTNWTCTATAGASCGAPSGSGAISDTININIGSTVTYTVTAQVAPNFAAASITNTATITPPGIVSDPNQANNTVSDTDTVVPGVVLALTKSDGSATYTPGGTAIYTVTVANTGAAVATQVNINDALPSGVTLAGNVTCAPAGTATCGTVTGGAGQTSFSATAATIPGGAGNTLTFSVPVAFVSTLTTSPLVNTVTATDVPSGATATASDSDTANATADVSIVKAGPASVIPGAPLSYTLTIRNAGPSAANNMTFSDPVPASITGITASCGGAAGGAVCPGSVTVAGNTVSGTIVTLPPGGSVVVTINGTTSASANASIANTATVTAPSGTTDPTSGNNTSTATTAIQPVVNLTKTVDATTVIPGDTVHYTITVTNTGPVAANNTLVTDPLPNGITAQTWTCASAGGAACPTAAGSGAISQTVATFPSGGSIVYTVTATVSTTPPTNINNTATATPQNGACSPANTPAPCSATATLPPVPQIGVSKTANTTTVTPGGTITYTVVVSNTGVVPADGTPVDDPMAAGIASQTWTCAASAGAACTSASGTGSISDVIATFPAGGFVTYTVTAIVDATPPAIVSNTVTVTPTDPTTVCTPGNTPGPCVATANVTSNAQISITKTADTSALTPGGNVTYTITVTNTGAAPADGTTVDDPIPAGIASQTWTCAANAGAVCAASGTGAISDTLTAFPPGSFVTYTIVATIDANPPETVTNIATANPPPGGICTPGNTPAPCDAEVSGGAVPQISVTKTSDATGAVTPGGTVTYTVTATNAGSADAPGTLVSDTMPAGIASANWTCAASGGAACPNPTGSGDINETLATFPAGSSVVYTIVATVSATPPASINNTAGVMPASGVCLPGNTAPPCTATASDASAPQISVTKTADDPTYSSGGTLSWTMTVINTGSAPADGTTVSDPLPAGILSSGWTCVPAGGAVCANTSGNGAIAESIPTFPPGGTVTYLISGTVATPAPTGITNTAAATPPAGGTCAPANAAPPCTAAASTQSAPSVTITKSVVDASGNGVAEPGETLTYTIVLANAGGTDATGFGVSDPIDANTTFVSADNGGTFAGGVVTWFGLTVPAGGNVVLHVVTAVRTPLTAGVTQIANVAYQTGTAAPPCPPIGPQCAVLPTPGSVKLTKSVIDASGNGIAEPGETLSFTILLTNTGGSDVTSYGVTDPLDPNLVFASADNGGTETGGIVTWTDLVVPAGGSLTLSVVATVADPLLSGVTQIANVAYETGTAVPACPSASPQCVVLPTPGEVSIAKSVIDASGNGIAEPGETLTYTIALTNTGGSTATNVPVTDPLDPNTTFVSASNGGVAAGGVVNWTGLTVPANGTLALTVVVTVNTPIPPGVTQLANVAYQTGTAPPACPPAGPACVITPTASHVTIGKVATTPAPTGTPNQYQITYTATVNNTGGSVGSYDLTDTLTFNGATLTAISVPVYASSTGDTQTGTLGSFTAPSGGTIVTGESIAAAGIETWTYTVTYTITDAATAQDCTDPNNGLRNQAALGGNAAGASPADTCSGAPNVNVLKTASAPVATGNPNEFTLTYTVNVSNSGTLTGVYTLADTLSFNGATVSAISAPTYSSSTGDTQDGTFGSFTAPNGGTIVSGESIGAGGAETWVYTVTYTITNATAAEDCANPAGGLRNDAELGGSLVGESTTCTGAPAVDIGKSASGPTPTGNPNEYKLVYLVTVQNNGTLAGLYDLDDAFRFPGVSNVSVSAVQHGGADPLATPLGTLTATGGSIVTGETIAAGSSETYTYSVVFTVDDATLVGNCALGGGLVNNAALGGSSSGQVGTCSSVPDIAIAKSASGPTATGTPNQYTLTYTVTVSNNGGAEGTYDLADAFAFAGATIDAVSAVTHGGGDPLSSTLGTLTLSGGTIVTAETIAAGESETYTYTLTLTLTDPTTANDCTNPAGGLRNAATLGGSVSGEADTCSGVPVMALVKALTGESGSQPGIAEPGETLTYTITLTNSGSIDATAYGVIDPLDANVTFVSASNGGAFAGGIVTWTNLTIPAGGTLALTVVVTADSPLPSGAATITNLAYPNGGTRPDCSLTPTPAGCVVTPTEGIIAIAKSVVDASGNGLAEPGETLTYTITLTNTNGGDVTNYGVTDPLDANVTFVSADNGGAFAGGAVSWSGLTIPSGGTLNLTVVVTVNNPLPAGVAAIGNLAYETGGTPPDCTAAPLPANCTILPTPAVVSLAKSVADASGNGIVEPGETLTYTITLTNTGGSAATNLPVTDPLDANTTFVSASNGGTFATGSVTWTGLTVPANGTLSLTVVVTVHSPLPAGVTTIGNLVYQTGGTPPDCTATPLPANCASIPTAPHVVLSKTASTPTPTGNPNEYKLTYVATVHNDGGSGDAYTLGDTLTFNGATVTAISPPLYASPNGQVQDGTLGSFTAPSGGTIVMGEDIDAGGIDTWTYTVTYTITDSTTADNCTDPNGGLRNSAVASGNASGTAPAAATCAGAPSVSVLKTASAPLPTGTPNEFTLTYTVNVSNSGTLPGVYDLSDVLTFNGATISAISTPVYNSSSGDPQDGTLGAFGLPDGGVIVTDESISAGGAQSWVYTVTYTITDAVTAEDCSDLNGGLRNSAALGGSLTGRSTTCTGAPAVVIGKSASGPTPTGNSDEYTLAYLVTVQNNGSLVGTYDLGDTFSLPGVSGVSVSAVQHGGADPLGGVLGTLGPDGGTIVTGETIAAGSNETYTYVVTFTIDDASAIGLCANDDGLTNIAELGGSSSGVVGTCSDVPSVSIAKTASAPAPTGTPNQYAITYTVTIHNTGAATGSYDLSDAFAFAGATIDAVGAVTHAGADPLATTLGTLTPAGGTIVTAETIAGASSESYAYTVTFTLTDPTAANDCTTPAGGLRNAASLGGSAVGEADTCTGAPSVTLAKELSNESGTQPGIAEPGETLTYTITLSNSGTTDATSYGVTDPLDANVTFVSASNGGTAAGGTVTWTNLTVPANGTLTLTVVVKVSAPIPAEVAAIGNLAYATGSTPPDCTAIPTPPACVITPTPGVVSIAKTVADANGNGLAEPGETLTYTITLRNTSGGDALNYGVTDPLDANVTFVSASNGGTFGAGTVTWSNLTIAAGQSVALTVTVTVNAPLPASVTQIGNLAYQTGGAPPDCSALPQPANCTVIPVPVPGAITLVKTVSDASGDGLAEPGETLNYTIMLSNGGGQDVVGYGVTDPLDANTTFASADNGGISAGNTVTWTGLTIPASGSLTLHVVVTVNTPLPGTVTQIGNLAYQTGGTPPDCTALPRPVNCTVIPVPAPGAITLVKTVADATGNGVAEPGETLTYTITLSNSGGQDVVGYGVTDPLDANTTFVNADNGGSAAGNTVTWTGLTIPAGGSLALHVVVTVNSPLPGNVTQIGNLAYPTGGTPPDCTATPRPPGCAVIVTSPPGAPLLSIAKTLSTPELQPAGTAVYTLTVANVGTAAATDATISDPIAAGLTGYTWTCAASGGASCANASGSGAIAETIALFPPSGVLVYTVTATIAADPPASIVNTASVTPSGLATCAPSGTPPPCSATAIGTVAGTPPGQPAIPTPTTNPWMLLLLGLGLFGVARQVGRRLD